jgi:hypothetical protein
LYSKIGGIIKKTFGILRQNLRDEKPGLCEIKLKINRNEIKEKSKVILSKRFSILMLKIRLSLNKHQIKIFIF